MVDLGKETHQDGIGGSGSGDINKGEGGTHTVVHAVEDFLPLTAKKFYPYFCWCLQCQSQRGHLQFQIRIIAVFVLVLVVVVDFVIWLVFTGEFRKGGINTPLITLIPTLSPTISLMPRTTIILSPQKCLK